MAIHLTIVEIFQSTPTCVRSYSDGWIGYTDRALGVAEIRSPEEQEPSRGLFVIDITIIHWLASVTNASSDGQEAVITLTTERVVLNMLNHITVKSSCRNHVHNGKKIQPTQILFQNLCSNCENIFFSSIHKKKPGAVKVCSLTYTHGCSLSLLLRSLSFTWFVNWSQVSI